MIRLRQATAENFLSYRKIDVSFERQGLVLVEGDPPRQANGAGKCLPEGTRVALWDGSMKEIQDIRETDVLVGLDSNTWKWIPENPLYLKTSGVQAIYELTTSKGFKIQATGHHKLLSVTGWKPLSEFLPEDHIAVPMALPCIQYDDQYRNVESYLVGLLLGDGSVTLGMGFTNQNPDILAIFRACVQHLFPGSKIREDIKDDRNYPVKQLTVSFPKTGGKGTKPHRDWLKKYNILGKNSSTKRVPMEFFGYGESSIRFVLAGLFCTDAWICTDGQFEYSTISYGLAHDVRSLLLRIGVPCVVKKQVYKGYTSYRITGVTARGRRTITEKVIPLIPFSKFKKSRRLKDGASRSFSLPHEFVLTLYKLGKVRKDISSWFTNRSKMGHDKFLSLLPFVRDDLTRMSLQKLCTTDIGWDKVSSVEYVGPLQTWDIQMPSEAFVANDFLVHNSALLSLAPWVIWDKVLREVQDVAGVVNRDTQLCAGKLVGDLDSTPWSIERSRSSNGKTLLRTDLSGYSRKPDGQEQIDHFLGTYTEACNTVLYGQDRALEFLSAGDNKRKLILEEMLKIDPYRTAQKEVKDDLTWFRARKMELESQIRIIDLEITNSILEIHARASWMTKETEAQYKLVSEQLQDTRMEWELQRRVPQLSYQPTELMKTESEVNGLLAKHTKIVATGSAVQSKLSELDKIITRLFEEQVCPTCGQSVHGMHQENVTKLRDEARFLQDEYDSSVTEVTQIEADYLNAQGRLHRLQSEHVAKSQEKAEMQQKVRSLEERIAKLESAKNQLHALLQSGYGNWEEQLWALSGKQQQLNRLQKLYYDLCSVIPYLEFCDSAFGYHGIPSLLIERALPVLNYQTNEFLSIMSNGRFVLEIRPTYQGSKGQQIDELTFMIQDHGREVPLKALSAGERRRVVLSLFLAFPVVRHNLTGTLWNTLFIDEMLDILDEEGIERSIQLLRSMVPSRFETVLLVSHTRHSIPIHMFDQVWKVSHRNGYSELVTA